MQKIALITGASTGIGFACTEACAKNIKVYAGYRKETDREKLALIPNVTPVKFDVTDPSDIDAVIQMISTNEGKLDILFNNAGVAIPGPLEFLKIDQFTNQLHINVVSQLAVTQKALPLLRKSQDARILFTSSISGIFAKPMTGAYSASKHALEGMCDALRLELKPFGIKVIIIEPGTIKTPIWEKAIAENKIAPKWEGDDVLMYYGKLIEQAQAVALKNAKNGTDVSEVVDVFLHGIQSNKPRTRYLAGRDAKIQMFLKRFTTDLFLDKFILKMLAKKG